MGEEGLAEISTRYLRFADTEAHSRSPLYEELARAVAGDRETLGFLSTLPDVKRQPNLLLAVVRHLFGTPTGWTEFRQALLAHPELVRSLMLERSTQTNEPGRCATLLPVLARLPQPLALLEVGSSAGLCLMPDLYSYDYGRTMLRAPVMASEPPVFRCSASETTPLPTAPPHVVWRAGLDLSPIDASDASQVAWLETLVWPEQTARLANLRGGPKDRCHSQASGGEGRPARERPRAALQRSAKGRYPRCLSHGRPRLCLRSCRQRGFRRTGDAAFSVLGIERVPSRIPVHRHTRRKKLAARPLPPICERLPCRLDRPAWRLARMDRGRGVGGIPFRDPSVRFHHWRTLQLAPAQIRK